MLTTYFTILYHHSDKISKKNMILKVFVIIGYFCLTQSQTRFMPNLPVGEYRLNIEKVYPCDSSNYTLQFNCFLSKKTVNTYELKGNITLFKPLDDILKLDVNFSSWSLTGGWKPNSMVYIANNACSSMKRVLGNAFLSLTKGYHIPTSSCPLPAGEYRTVFEKLYSCDSTRNYPLQFNNYFNKKTAIITELKGNVTTLIPFDDTLTLDINLASWGSTGGWIPNSNAYITKKACSALKNLGGNVWLKVTKDLNIPNSSCPVPVGTYTTSGINLKTFEDHNFPKVYFYGKYKMVFKVKNIKDEVLGCKIVEINLIRPWENPF